MEIDTGKEMVEEARPRTAVVLGLLLAAVTTVSWLGSYALINVLVAADFLPGWGGGQDPRPMTFAIEFLGLIVLFAIAHGVVRAFGMIQMRRMDSEEEA